MISIVIYFKRHGNLHRIHLWSLPLFNKELRQILYEYKKGVDRCVYLNGALQCLVR